jgi:gag-polypeptide of LTR copia-type
MTEGDSLDTHMLRMMSDVGQLEKLNNPLSKEFATDVILNSLSPSCSNFIEIIICWEWARTCRSFKGC